MGGIKMTDNQINIAIAEAFGWRQSERNIAHWYHVLEPYSHILTRDLPNYCNDLNAMHEAEKGLNKNQWVDYGRELSRLNVFPMVHATARQRAEAFLRTIGKWKETK
jgi:hypothetical protein